MPGVCAGQRSLQQSSDNSSAYVKIQMAFLTTGAVAASLQQQLLSSLSGALITAIQQAGVAVSSIVFSSLDVQQVSKQQVQLLCDLPRSSAVGRQQ